MIRVYMVAGNKLISTAAAPTFNVNHAARSIDTGTVNPASTLDLVSTAVLNEIWKIFSGVLYQIREDIQRSVYL